MSIHRICPLFGLLWLFPLPSEVYPVVLMVPILVARAPSPTAAGFSFAGYVGVATAAFSSGIEIYFDSVFAGFTIWLLIIALMFVAGFIARLAPPSLRVIALFLLTSLPPLSLAAWPHPFALAGYVLPGFGLAGLFVVIGILSGLVFLSDKWVAGCAVIVLIAANVAEQSVVAPDGWQGLDLADFNADATEFQQHTKLQKLARRAGAQNVVFPEAVVGEWNAHACDLWRQALDGSNKKVYFGAFERTEGGDKYSNVVVKATQKNCEIVHRQRFPIPIAMWRPWAPGSAIAHGFQDQSGSVSWLICYEATQVWAVIDAIRHRPDVLVHIANLWWAPPSIMRAQQITVAGWATLFNVPLVEAYQNV